MYESRNKQDLVIEVWELLDCESIGAAELIEIEKAVAERFGKAAVDSPMITARMLADEGAVLRHSEIMQLFVDRNGETIYDAALRNIVEITDHTTTLASIRRMENARRKFSADNDKEGLRLLREKALKFKDVAHARSLSTRSDPRERLANAEIAEWLTIWLQTPDLFESWAALRVRSPEYVQWFGSPGDQTDA